MTCEIFQDQGSNSCPLHWQVDSFLFRKLFFFFFFKLSSHKMGGCSLTKLSFISETANSGHTKIENCSLWPLMEISGTGFNILKNSRNGSELADV